MIALDALWFAAKPQGYGASGQGYRMMRASKFQVRGNTAQLRLKLADWLSRGDDSAGSYLCRQNT